MKINVTRLVIYGYNGAQIIHGLAAAAPAVYNKTSHNDLMLLWADDGNGQFTPVVAVENKNVLVFEYSVIGA